MATGLFKLTFQPNYPVGEGCLVFLKQYNTDPAINGHPTKEQLEELKQFAINKASSNGAVYPDQNNTFTYICNVKAILSNEYTIVHFYNGEY